MDKIPTSDQPITQKQRGMIAALLAVPRQPYDETGQRLEQISASGVISAEDANWLANNASGEVEK